METLSSLWPDLRSLYNLSKVPLLTCLTQHAPWQAPQRLYDLYNESELHIAQHKTLPLDAPLIAWANVFNVSLANGTYFTYGPEDPVPDWVMRDQRHAYYASVSSVDENVGAIIQHLKDSGHYDDTVVMLLVTFSPNRT